MIVRTLFNILTIALGSTSVRTCSSTYALSFQFTDLGTLGGTTSSAAAIDNAGLIVGSSATTGNAASHPVL